MSGDARHGDSEAPVPADFRAGWDAYVARQKISANPHDTGSPRWVAWREGFIDAEGEHHKDLMARGL